MPIISSQLFLSRLEDYPHEDVSLIKLIESQLIKKRGHVVHLPKKGSPVILLASGGLDSTCVWSMLLERCGYRVYPLFLNRSQGRVKKELRSVNYFSRYFARMYPGKSYPVKVYDVRLPPKEVENEKASVHPDKYYHPEQLLRHISDITFPESIPKYSELTFTYPLYGMYYASFLERTKNIKIKTIFHAVMPSDGSGIVQQSFTSLRVAQLAACATSNDYSWEIISFPFEKEIGNWLTKAELISFAYINKVPIERTWSCFRNGIFQCGDQCAACICRRHGFHLAAIMDYTKYMSTWKLPFHIILKHINIKLKKI